MFTTHFSSLKNDIDQKIDLVIKAEVGILFCFEVRSGVLALLFWFFSDS